jgi:hypothetical protein
MATAAFILTIIANSRCELLKVSNDSTVFQVGAIQSIGLWCLTTENGTFYDISGLEGDSKFQAARGTLVT